MRKSADRICQHCGELIVGNAYRVTSEEEGISAAGHDCLLPLLYRGKKPSPSCGGINVRTNKLQLETEGCIHSTERG